jgi:hypothetical protein
VRNNNTTCSVSMYFETAEAKVVTPCDIIQLVTANERNNPHPPTPTVELPTKQYHSLFSKKSTTSTRFIKTKATRAIFVRTSPCLPYAPYPSGRFPFPSRLMQKRPL